MKRSATRIVAGGGAACVRLGAELLAEDEEQSTELGALGLGQAGEEFVFGVALCLGGAFELLLPARMMVTTCQRRSSAAPSRERQGRQSRHP